MIDFFFFQMGFMFYEDCGQCDFGVCFFEQGFVGVWQVVGGDFFGYECFGWVYGVVEYFDDCFFVCFDCVCWGVCEVFGVGIDFVCDGQCLVYVVFDDLVQGGGLVIDCVCF